MPHQAPSPETQQCINDCAKCSTTCAQTAHHCLHLGGEHAGPNHQGLLQDCKQICALAAGFMSRSSHYAGSICRECAEICAACADECDRMANGDEMMRQCAEVCRSCAQSCEKMAAAGV
jgi:hypothetical protein